MKIMRDIPFILVGSLLLTLAQVRPATAGFADEYKFGAAVNLGPAINSANNDGAGISVTADGDTLCFASNRPGGVGNYDIYCAQRINGEWQPAENLGPTINSPNSETEPVISPDGNRLYFASWNGYYSQIWMSEKIDGEWQPAIHLPPTVNFSWANNDPKFISPDGQWLYMIAWGGMGMWDSYRVDLTTGDYSIVEQLPAPVNSAYRDYAMYLTEDSRYLLFISDRSNSKFYGYASEIINGIYQPPESLPSSFNNDFTLADDETILYFRVPSASGGLGGDDIYYARRLCSAADFVITNLIGHDAVINPLPLAGQTIDISAAISGSAGQPVSWQLTIDGKTIKTGTGLSVQAGWDGRNSENRIIPGTYNITLTAGTLDGLCTDSEVLPVNIDWDDNCLLNVSFPH